MNREDLKNLKTWISDYVERFYIDNHKDSGSEENPKGKAPGVIPELSGKRVFGALAVGEPEIEQEKKGSGREQEEAG